MSSYLFHAVAAAAILSFAGVAGATPITTTLVKSSSGFYGTAVDESTGKVYARASYNGESTVLVYASQAAFAAGTVQATIALGGGGFYGTYFEVSQGKIYGRTSSSGTDVARWDAATGARESARASFPGMGGSNGGDTFNWGGFSGVNFMQDQTGLYVFGHQSGGSNWSVNRIDADFNILQTTTASLGSLGYAFLVNGSLFASTSYSSSQITRKLDLATGVVTAVDFDLGVGGYPYWSNVSYDHSSDSLLFNNSYGSVNPAGFYRVDNASQQFGVPVSQASSVPVPATLTLAGLGLALLAGTRRRSA